MSTGRLWACLLLGMSFVRVTPAVELLFDFNSSSTALGSSPAGQHARVGALTLFVMDDGIHGQELWRTDGSAAGTALVKDIYPGPTGSGATALTELNGKVVFFADDGTNGMELWVSDGSSSGTHIVANIDSAPTGSVISFSTPMLQLNGTVLFSAGATVGHYTLWRSDGTAAGTWQVKDVDTSSGIGLTYLPTSAVIGAHLFFSGRDPIYGDEPWVSDGTPAGTHVIGDITGDAGDSRPQYFTRAGDSVYFAATSPLFGREFWRTDLAGMHARLVSDYVPGSADVNPTNLTVLGNQIFFGGYAGTPYASDGTVAGTQQLATLSYPDYQATATGIAVIGNRLIFEVGYLTSSLWATDGTAAGTVELQPQLYPSGLAHYVLFGGKLIFMGKLGTPYQPDAIVQTDGTPGGTSILANLPSGFASDASDLVAFGDRLYYPDGFVNATDGDELWATDPVTGATQEVKDINPGAASSSPNGLYVSNGKLFFFATDATHGGEPWVSDGSSSGTTPLCDCHPGMQTAGSSAVVIANLGSTALIGGYDGTHARLWVTDGTRANTKALHTFKTAPNYPSSAGVMSGVAYFTADDGISGNELWRSDGTVAGTYLVADIAPGPYVPPPCAPRSYCPPDPIPPPANSDPIQLGGTAIANRIFYFTANDVTHGRELWRTDGTAAGTRIVVDLNPGPGDGTTLILGAIGSRVYFCGVTTSVYGASFSLWATDGTAQGTVQVSSRVNCDQSAYQGNGSAVMNGILYFAANTADLDTELWRTDGTDSGTVRVIDIVPGSGGSYPQQLQVINNHLSFSAYDSSGPGFYLSDGTAAGTVRVPGIPSPAGPATLLGNQLLFNADSSGSSLSYVSDGTAAGTRPFLPASTSLFPKGINLTWVVKYLGKYVFTAPDAANNYGAWISDGTLAGTHPLFLPSAITGQTTSPYGLAVVGSNLLFSASTPQYGAEIYVVHSGAPSATDDVASTGFNTAASIAVLNNDGAIGSPLDPSSIGVVAQPSHGSVAIDMSSGMLTYTPQAGFSGMDQLIYQVADTAGGVSNPAQLNIIVAAPAGNAPAPAPSGSSTPTVAPPAVDTTAAVPPTGAGTNPPGGSGPPAGGSGDTGSGNSGSTPPSGGSNPPDSSGSQTGSQGAPAASGADGGGGGSESWVNILLLSVLVLVRASRRAFAPLRAPCQEVGTGRSAPV
jgi:ELWxxDGT repeat protein